MNVTPEDEAALLKAELLELQTETFEVVDLFDRAEDLRSFSCSSCCSTSCSSCGINSSSATSSCA